MDTKKLELKFESNNQSIEVGKGKPFRLLNIDGIESSDFELFIEDNIFHDGSRVNHKRVKGRPIMIEAEYVGKHKEVERRKLASFFNVHRNGYLTINYQGTIRKIKYEVESYKAPLRNLYEPLKFLLHIYCPNPYWLEEEKEMDLVTWIPNLEFDAVEGFSTEQLENHWIETQIKKQGLQVFKKGTIFVELEEESTVPEVEIAYLLENGQYKRLKQQATVFSTGTGYDENGNYVDVSDSIVNGQINEVTIGGLTVTNILGDLGDFEDLNKWSKYLNYGTLDNTKKVFGNYSLRQIKNNQNGYLYKDNIPLKKDKYYFLSLYRFVEVPSADSVSIVLYDNNTFTNMQIITTSFVNTDNLNVWERIGYKFQSTKDICRFMIGGGGLPTTTYNIDGLMLIEITEEEYNNLSVEELMQKYQYINGTKSTICAIRLKSVNEDESKESTLYVLGKDKEGNILELRSLPNGVKDEIDVANRRVIKRTKKIIFDGSENWERFTTAYADTNGFYRMQINGWVTQNKAVTGFDTGRAWNDLTTFRIVPGIAAGGLPNSIAFYTDGNLYLSLPRDYIDANYSPSIKGMRQYLADHPITLIYQLANPIVKLLPPEPLTTFEEFESGFGTGQAVELGYRLTKQIVEVDNIGDVETPIRAIFRAHGTVEKPYIQDVETREMLRINRTLQAGDVLEITTEFGNKNVYLNGEKAHHYLDFLNSTWLQLKPGINLIKYGAESGVDMLECRLYYTPRYLGV